MTDDSKKLELKQQLELKINKMLAEEQEMLEELRGKIVKIDGDTGIAVIDKIGYHFIKFKDYVDYHDIYKKEIIMNKENISEMHTANNEMQIKEYREIVDKNKV